MRIRFPENRYALFLPAVFFYCVHGIYILLDGTPSNLLWACHLGALVAGFGILFRLPSLNAVGVLWLGLGNIMWILYLLGKGEFMVTSVLTHVGGLVIGIMGIYQLGIPRFSWLKALAALALLQQICRWITVEKENVNLAFRVHEGWEKMFPSYSWYLVVLFVTAGAVFFSMELLLRKIKVSACATAQ